MQARSTASAQVPSSADEVRVRLVGGLLAAIEERGYAATTIADIVAHARVSKRTFYEQFEDKDALFLAAYKLVSDETMRVIAEAVASTPSWQEQIKRSVRAYLDYLDEHRALTKTFLLEVHAAGAAALKMRRRIHDQFADNLRALVEVAHGQGAAVERLSPQMAVAVIGGINELVLVALEKKQKLSTVAETASELVTAVVTRR